MITRVGERGPEAAQTFPQQEEMLALTKTIVTQESIEEQGQASGVGFFHALLFRAQITLTERAYYLLLGSGFKHTRESEERKRISQLPVDGRHSNKPLGKFSVPAFRHAGIRVRKRKDGGNLSPGPRTWGALTGVWPAG